MVFEVSYPLRTDRMNEIVPENGSAGEPLPDEEQRHGIPAFAGMTRSLSGKRKCSESRG